ncbi:pantoate--beta-alanine ligase [Flavilitoribacter nigricans]|uniref:Pantothenate synthetase n=1 Tax=Flavilitoribacter nigricans (strain ATCC 23147 / DSM 23189 / NBRC 102662 / NCIMB 1420 / SS-2) TaxID=1122177 RepID=A0A2D0N498_FLAN2|nr:pantoate--beta-alanine ligase [Flavilitoribacter nigricans]PHN03315.1 pantoate--beta-alanine ligase [Flavilitoribacter nigricans DSM 23189 = NBRC 102662]
MYLFQRSEDLQNWLQTVRGHNRKIGFVPTMGALHAGHLSLIDQSAAANTFTVCSIFVNPTQFNDHTDLEKYPRTPARDIELLVNSGCDALFLPAVGEVYPEGLDTGVDVSLGQLAEVMEGAFRPGHFAGVMQVVHRLLQLVLPDRLYMGQKDFQQQAIIQEMIRQLELPVELVMADIVREADGLAMSSRNVRLSPEFRSKAPLIHEILSQIKQDSEERSVAEWKTWAHNQLEQAGFRPEYLEIVDGKTLQPVSSFKESKYIVACVAAWAGDVRLIDNVIVRG